MDTSSGDNLISAIPEKNPLLLSPVITRILELLPLRDIKRARLINREWNSLAEPVLRKRAKIVFSSKFRPSDYFEYYSEESRLSALPFTAFQLTDRWDGSGGYLLADLDYFFNKCGKNIKSLRLESIPITKNRYDMHRMETMNINHWIELLPDNMDNLTISGLFPSISLRFNLENLRGVKCLSLHLCDVIVNSSNMNRIAPSEISLRNVTFLNESGNKLTDIVVNDFVDFSKCSNILIESGSDTAIRFDMSRDIVNAKKVEFERIDVMNSGFSKIKTDCLSVWRNPSEAIKMQMKELDIQRCPSVNLTHLPQTIEKLKIEGSWRVLDVAVPLYLPQLNYLHLAYPDGGVEFGLRLFQTISWFQNCSNLVEVHLNGGLWNGKGWKVELDVSWLPRSVKRLKLTDISEIVFLGDSHSIDVDVLLLGASMNSAAVEVLMEKIKPKTLVKIVMFHKQCGSEKAEDFISFVRRNTQLEKIVINTLYGSGMQDSSDRNSFRQFVGEESSCYEFNNQIVKAISEEEFEKFYDINCMTRAE